MQGSPLYVYMHLFITCMKSFPCEVQAAVLRYVLMRCTSCEPPYCKAKVSP